MGQQRRVPTIEAVVTKRPVNRTAALVTQPGPKGLESSKRIAQAHSDDRLTTVPVPRSVRDLRGRTFGTLTAIGLAEPTASISKQQGNQRLWVCRCVCGRYLTRRAKAINNPNNTNDRCDPCRQVAYLRRRSTFNTLGYNPDEC